MQFFSIEKVGDLGVCNFVPIRSLTIYLKCTLIGQFSAKGELVFLYIYLYDVRRENDETESIFFLFYVHS